jgi:hypothetical protein
MRYKSPRTEEQRAAIYAAVSANLESENPVPDEEIAAKMGVPVQVIWSARGAYQTVKRRKDGSRAGGRGDRRSWGILGRSRGLPEGPRRPGRPREISDLSGLEADLSTPEGRRAALDALIELAPDSVRVRAIALREELDRFSGIQVGPPPPETVPQTIGRVVSILKTLEPSTALAAWETYTKESSIAQSQAPESPVSQGPSPSGSDLA